MKYTYNITKAGFKFTIHSREYSDQDGDPTSDNPTVEFEVLDGKDYADAEDFFGVFDEITTAADNFDLVVSAISYADHHPIDTHTEYDSDLVDLIDTAIEMITNWNAFTINEQTTQQLVNLSKKLHSLK